MELQKYLCAYHYPYPQCSGQTREHNRCLLHKGTTEVNKDVFYCSLHIPSSSGDMEALEEEKQYLEDALCDVILRIRAMNLKNHHQ